MFRDLRMRRKQKQQMEEDQFKFSPNTVFSSITKNKEAMQLNIKKSIDIVYYEFQTPDQKKFLLVSLHDIIDKEYLDRDVLGGLISGTLAQQEPPKNVTADYLKSLIHFSNIKESTKFEEIIPKMLSGNVILFADGLNTALCLPIKGWEQRSIQEPDAEIITRGPREGFVETLKTNRSMIRRKMKNRFLVFEHLILGLQSNTSVNIVYIDNIVNHDILNMLRQRLQNIKLDAILDAAYIEELIRDEQMSPFNTIGYTERPDVVVAKLLEGRIAIMLDGTPVVLTVPFLFVENLQVNEDYYSSFFAASINRMIRFVSFLLTVFVPGLYVALVTNHHEIIPQKLLFSLIAARVGVPFPTIIEVLAMIVTFELLRESGLRLPKGLGQTVSIVGALVLGQAAVEAKFISAPVVIVIAITAISSFIFYNVNGALMITRFIVTLMGAFFGLYGVTLSLIGIFIHLYSLQSFGIPYMSYIGSTKGQELKDSLIRAPWWYMYLRPKIISTRNYIRKGRVQK